MSLDRKLMRQKAKMEFKKLNKERKIPKSKRLPFNAVYKVMISTLNNEKLSGSPIDNVAQEVVGDLSDIIDVDVDANDENTDSQ